tara:strand:+ start:5002 stop:5151 length:150 start_codon:yes stop_codon:yes gene_type:complete
MFFTHRRDDGGAGKSSSPHIGSEDEGSTSPGGAERCAIANAMVSAAASD